MLKIPIKEIPANRQARTEGESQNTFLRTFAYIKISINARFYKNKDIIERKNHENIIGSISLSNGASIDDYTFKKYNKKLNSKEKIILLNPSNIKNGYIFNTGWVSPDKNISVPSGETKWKVLNNNKLTPGNPVSLFYENEEGLRFEKTISLDE